MSEEEQQQAAATVSTVVTAQPPIANIGDMLPTSFPALVAPREVFYRIPFKVQLYVRIGDTPDVDEVARAVLQGTLSTKCFREGENESNCNGITLKNCPRCQTDKLVEVMGVRETVGPEVLGGGSIYRFTFDTCRSFCSSSRLHLRSNLVLGLAVKQQGSCIVYSNPISLMSKIVKRSSVSPSRPSLITTIQQQQQQQQQQQLLLPIDQQQLQQQQLLLLQQQILLQQQQQQLQQQQQQQNNSTTEQNIAGVGLPSLNEMLQQQQKDINKQQQLNNTMIEDAAVLNSLCQQSSSSSSPPPPPPTTTTTTPSNISTTTTTTITVTNANTTNQILNDSAAVNTPVVQIPSIGQNPQSSSSSQLPSQQQDQLESPSKRPKLDQE